MGGVSLPDENDLIAKYNIFFRKLALEEFPTHHKDFQKIVDLGSTKFLPYGVDGSRSDFWRTETKARALPSQYSLQVSKKSCVRVSMATGS